MTRPAHRWLVAALVCTWLAGVAFAWWRPSETTDAAEPWALLVAFAAGAAALLVAPETLLGSRLAWWGALVGSSVLTWYFGHRHIGGFDHSLVVDFAWRQHLGQEPYRDFPSTVPVGFLAGTRWMFDVGGVRWSAVVGAAVLGGVVTTMLTRLAFGLSGWTAAEANVFSFVATGCTFVLCGYWWYNAYTAAAAAVFCSGALAVLARPRSIVSGGIFAVGMCLALGGKPNVSGPLLLGILATLLAHGPSRRTTATAAFVATSTFLALLTAVGWDPLIVLRGYLGVAGHATSLPWLLAPRWYDVGLALLLPLGFGAAAAWAALGFGGAAPSSRGVAAAAFVGGLAGILINGEHRLVDAPLLVFAAYIPARRTAVPTWFRRGLQAATAGLIFMSLTVGGSRARVRLIGPGAFYEPTVVATQFHGFLEGVEGGATLHDVDERVREVLDRFGSEGVFFGPRMQWAYAAYGLPSPIGEPVWWQGGVAYPAEEEPGLIRSWVAHRYRVAIFFKADRSYLPATITEAIGSGYRSLVAPPLLVWVREDVAAAEGH